jgi:uncharacterized secreted protein with C-terminal beta-propeller domain
MHDKILINPRTSCIAGDTMKHANRILIALVLISILALTGCQPSTQTLPGTTTKPTTTTTQTTTTSSGASLSGTYTESYFDEDTKIETKQFASKAELLSFISENSGSGGGYYGAYYKGGMMVEAAMDSSMATGAPAPKMAVNAARAEEGDSGSRQYSETNVQVKGVDEADIIKNDGSYIYTVSSNVLFIITAYPGEEAKVISRIKLEDRPESIFIEGDKLAVFGNVYSESVYSSIRWRPTYGMTYLNVYDISDKTNPGLEKEFKFEGSYFRGRMSDGYMYILTSTYPEYRIDPLPVLYEGNTKKEIPIGHIYYYDIPYQNAMFVNIHSMKLSDPSTLDSHSIAVEGSQEMYMSEDNIYVTYTEYINEYDIQKRITMDVLGPNLTSEQEAFIDKVKKTDNDILGKYEKDNKIYQVYERILYSMSQDERDELQDGIQEKLKDKLEEIKYFQYTVINKIGIDSGKITPVANAKVPGRINNQFSMDESSGVLRIATTLDQHWSSYGSQQTKSSNSVYTLDSDLKQLDALEGLAEDEQIYSTRFIDDRLYMVTFRQVDPFFVIDLSNPNKIKELGKLKIPGYSKYLHPYDEDTIIGIGQEATSTGRINGLKVSLFDVSDVANPKELAKYTTDDRYASSTALWEHKAFLFSKEKELLVIPAYNYDYEDRSSNYNGAFVFDITKSSISLRGLIDHSQGKTEYWQPAVERSLYIEELLYTKSENLLRINKIEDLSKVANIELNYTSVKIPVY